MIRTKLLAIIAATAIAITSCTLIEGTSKHRKKGTPIASTKAAVEKVLADKKANEGKRFAITGYLDYSANMTVYTNRPQTVYVYPDPEKSSPFMAMADMHWEESGHNSVFVPKDGGGDGSKTLFYDNDGKPLTSKDKVMISFSVDESSNNLTEVRIDKAQ